MPLAKTPDGMPPGLITDMHPGDWRLHHIAVLRHGQGRGDFTPEYVSHDIEAEFGLTEHWIELLGELLGVDHAAAIAARGRAADIEAG